MHCKIEDLVVSQSIIIPIVVRRLNADGFRLEIACGKAWVPVAWIVNITRTVDNMCASGSMTWVWEQESASLKEREPGSTYGKCKELTMHTATCAHKIRWTAVFMHRLLTDMPSGQFRKTTMRDAHHLSLALLLRCERNFCHLHTFSYCTVIGG